MSKKLPPVPKYTTHAKLSASSAYRWTVCTGSVALCEHIPNKNSEYAALGTFAHHIGGLCLQSPELYKPSDWLGVSEVVDGYTVECDEEMVEALDTYLEIVRGFHHPGTALMVEVDLTPALQKLHPDLGGTGDSIVIDANKKRLDVFDYKHGTGVAVVAEDNKQMKVYALGALLTMETPVDRVGIHIVQPRHQGKPSAIESFEFDAIELTDFAADLVEAAKATEDFDAPLVPGQPQCNFCPAAGNCPALEKKSQELISAEFDVVGQDLTLDTLGKALDIIPLVEERIKNIRELAYQAGLKGTPPPGYKIVQKVARRQWADQDAAEQFVDMMLGDDGFTEPRLKSPAQVEKLLKDKDAKKQLNESLVMKVSSGYTLVSDDDKRQPALLASPDDFENVEN